MPNIFNKIRQGALIGTAACLIALCAPLANAQITVNGSFGPNGDVGFPNSPPGLSITFGTAAQSGAVYQMDGFVHATGVDFGNGAGVSRQLMDGPPPGLDYLFQASQPTPNQLKLSYLFTNNTGMALPDFEFLY